VSRRRSAARDRLELAGYRLARWAATAAGRRGADRLGTAIGDLFWRVGRSRRRVVEFNLALAYPELEPAARSRLGLETSRHFGRLLMDALRIRRWSETDLEAAVTWRHRERLHEAAAAGRGLFLLTAHLGSWEMAALAVGHLLESGIAVVGRPLDNRLLDAELETLRGRFGNRVLSKRGSARDILREVRGGGAVGILIDQRAREGEGIRVPFFGHPALTTPVLARMADRTEALVVPVFCLRTGPQRYEIEIGPPLDVRGLTPAERAEEALTARLTAILEEAIRRTPEQWLWYHDRWRELRR